jgi:hydrogenase expression/formation protein HypE
MTTNIQTQGLTSCPVPQTDGAQITLMHGGGGTAMHRLIERVFGPAFENAILNQRHDSATLSIEGKRLAFTTDSFVVQPLVFPGGNIGTLAINGTVNDLAMAGARPLYLSAGFILEAGLSTELLVTIVHAMRKAADEAGISIVTGDTKVIDRKNGDGMFINTAGIGIIEHDLSIGPASVKLGDAVLINGDLGRHGVAIMAVREGLEFESVVKSDCASLSRVVLALLEAGVRIHCLRDLTRGGLTSAANEIAEASGLSIHLNERAIPVREDVQGACELLGLEPLSVANEGRFVLFVEASDAPKAMDILKTHAVDGSPAIIGEVTNGPPGRVTIAGCLGAVRFLDMLSGEQLPRIC